jgi:hypothetical protein
MARSILAPLVSISLLLGVSACDQKQDPYKAPEKKKRVDLHNIDNTMSEEELVAARKEAGIKSPEEKAAEGAAWWEAESRKWVKARIPEYRKLIEDMRGFLDEIEKQAPKWKDDAAFTKFKDKHDEKLKEFLAKYQEVTGEGGQGGKTQEPLAAAFAGFDQLLLDIGPGVIENEAFPGAIQQIRENLDKVVAAVDEIDKDDTIDLTETETGGEGAAKAPSEKPDEPKPDEPKK